MTTKNTGLLRWRCRRGMRELDVLLERYLEERYPCAPSIEQQAFEALLELPDPELHAYLCGARCPRIHIGHMSLPRLPTSTRDIYAFKRPYPGRVGVFAILTQARPSGGARVPGCVLSPVAARTGAGPARRVERLWTLADTPGLSGRNPSTRSEARSPAPRPSRARAGGRRFGPGREGFCGNCRRTFGSIAPVCDGRRWVRRGRIEHRTDTVRDGDPAVACKACFFSNFPATHQSTEAVRRLCGRTAGAAMRRDATRTCGLPATQIRWTARTAGR